MLKSNRIMEIFHKIWYINTSWKKCIKLVWKKQKNKRLNTIDLRAQEKSKKKDR